MTVKLWKFAPIAVLVSACAPVFGQLRMVQYNTGNQNDANGYYTTIFGGIAAQSVNGIARPIDIITLQETTATLVGTSGNTGSSLIAALNRAAGTTDDYAIASIAPISNGDQEVVIYRKSTVDLISGSSFTTPGPRPIAVAQLRAKGYTAASDLYVYSAHLKASTGSDNVNERASEAAAMRLNADNLGANKNVIYGGDFNLYTSSEQAYINLKGATSSSQVTTATNNAAVDPVAGQFVSGDWTSSSAKILHTQAPTTTEKFPGQVTGGMDDRFDFALPSKSAADGEGVAIISGSYRAYGNNGTHTYNQAISSGTGASSTILTALESASDHIPVVSDYQLPARMTATIGTPSGTTILRNTNVTVNVATANSAAVQVVAGADELDYSITTTGSVLGAATGTVNALAGAQNKTLTLNTATAGAQSGSATVTATSEQVPDAPVSRSFSYTVVDASNASFSPTADENSKTVDFGVVRVGTTGVSQTFTVYNLAASSGFTADLALTSSTRTSGSGINSNLAAFTSLAAGSTGRNFLAAPLTSNAGTLATTFSLAFADAATVLGGTASQSGMAVSMTADIVSYANGAAGTTVGIPQLTGVWRPDAMPSITYAFPSSNSSLSITGFALCPDISPTLLVDFDLTTSPLSVILEDWTLDGATHGYTVSTYPLDPTALLVTFADTSFFTSGVTFSWNLTGTGATVASVVAIPEPSAIAGVLVVGAGLLSRRRRV